MERIKIEKVGVVMNPAEEVEAVERMVEQAERDIAARRGRPPRSGAGKVRTTGLTLLPAAINALAAAARSLGDEKPVSLARAAEYAITYAGKVAPPVKEAERLETSLSLSPAALASLDALARAWDVSRSRALEHLALNFPPLAAPVETPRSKRKAARAAG